MSPILKTASGLRHFYVGYSATTMGSRESARKRKQRQKGLVEKEPAFLFWEETKTYWKYVPIVLARHASRHDARVHEQTLISSWQPSNYRQHVDYVPRLALRSRHTGDTAHLPPSCLSRRSVQSWDLLELPEFPFGSEAPAHRTWLPPVPAT